MKFQASPTSAWEGNWCSGEGSQEAVEWGRYWEKFGMLEQDGSDGREGGQESIKVVDHCQEEYPAVSLETAWI